MKQEPEQPSPEPNPGDDAPKKAQIDYPVEWGYTLFGTSEADVRQALNDVLGQRAHNFAPSKTSRGGKYASFHISLQVLDEEDRNQISERLSEHPGVLFVL